MNLHRVDFFSTIGCGLCKKSAYDFFIFYSKHWWCFFSLSVFISCNVCFLRVEKKKLQYNLKWNVICFVLYTKFPCRGKSKWKIFCYIYIYNFFLNKGVLKKLYISCDNLVKNIIYSPLQFIQYIYCIATLRFSTVYEPIPVEIEPSKTLQQLVK